MAADSTVLGRWALGARAVPAWFAGLKPCATTEGRASLTAAVLALCFATACNPHQQATGGASNSSQPGAPARRIISLVPAVTEMLFAIGAGPQVIAVSSFDHYPREVEKLPRVGALLDPDLERVIALRPDLVVVYGSQSELIEKLHASGIRAFSYTLGGLDNVTETMRRLGGATGRAGDADRVCATIDAQLAAIRRRVAGLPRPRTLVVFGRDPDALRNIDASGGVGFLHDLVELAGGTNVFGEIRSESVRATTEMILGARPDVIIDLRYGAQLAPGEVERERRAWDELAALPAVRHNRVYVLVGDQYVVPGPRVVETAERFADAMHPGEDRRGNAAPVGPGLQPRELVVAE